MLLTPLPAPGRRLPQKRLLGAYDEAAEGDGKRRRAEPCDPERADGGSDGDADSDGTELGQVGAGHRDGRRTEPPALPPPPPPFPAARTTGPFSLQDGSPQLSAYERKRLKNISENAKFFAALKLHEVGAGPGRVAASWALRLGRSGSVCPTPGWGEPRGRRCARGWGAGSLQGSGARCGSSEWRRRCAVFCARVLSVRPVAFGVRVAWQGSSSGAPRQGSDWLWCKAEHSLI